MAHPLTAAERARYDGDGFLFPLDVLSAPEIAAARAELETVESRLKDQTETLATVRGFAHFVMPMVDRLSRDPRLLEPVASILGPDLLVYGCSFFVKEPGSRSYISWHQDLHYWGLDRDDELTAWLALSPATVESGCMKFVAGSHRRVVPHADSFHADNLLSRGQELAVQVDEKAAVDVVLKPGQMSLHHGRTVHASNSNASEERRIGMAIRYISTDMRQAIGGKTAAILVRGEDRYGHFELVPPPSGLLDPADMARMTAAVALQNQVLYRGAEHAAPALS